MRQGLVGLRLVLLPKKKSWSAAKNLGDYQGLFELEGAKDRQRGEEDEQVPKGESCSRADHNTPRQRDIAVTSSPHPMPPLLQVLGWVPAIVRIIQSFRKLRFIKWFKLAKLVAAFRVWRARTAIKEVR